ncbi:MAG: aminotransferase class I/II-fold pyridoxal phosphate-dependent enzyme [Alphaproteobacteria bacterium]|nr:aminotransferase class I/II-fold pyridoxal phosphate-dependent enzyme [Alphaproteobacteria bacterium]
MNQPATVLDSLALEGGAPLRTRPFTPRPVFAEDERKASDAVIASGRVNYWTGGVCKAFEEEFAAMAGVAQAISLAKGTLALELGLRALGIGPGDEVIVPAKTFVATASCAVEVGATPVVCDVEPNSQNLSAATVLPAARRLSEASLMFLVHPTFAEADMLDTARAVVKVMRAAARA